LANKKRKVPDVPTVPIVPMVAIVPGFEIVLVLRINATLISQRASCADWNLVLGINDWNGWNVWNGFNLWLERLEQVNCICR
jgi:hypothetical protein